MRIVSDDIKNALKQPTTQRKGKILVNGNYYEVYNVEYYSDAYEGGNVIGNAIASQLDFDLPYMDKFDTFKYFDGVWTGNDYEYVDMGTFTVFDEQDEDEFNKHITAFDNLIKFNAPFEEVGTYPKTLYEELQNVCRQADVELVNVAIPNGNFEIENNQFVNGETLKTVLKAICQISGNYGIIKEDKLVLQLTNDTDETILKNQHEPVIWKRRTYGINQVILQLGDVEGEYVIRQDEADIAENGAHKLVITNNPFAYTQDKRDALIDELFNQVRGFGYIPYEMNYEWLNYLEIGDKITIDGIETLVLRIQGKSPKGLESMMSAPGIIDSAVEYADNTNSIKNQISRTEIIVDKQNREIEAVTNSVQDLTSFLKTIEGTNEVILENTADSNGAINRLELSGFIEKTLYPGMSYPSNNVYPGKITTYVITQESEDGTQYNETYIDLGMVLLGNDKLIIENNKVFVEKNNNNINTGLEVILKTFEGKTKIKVKYFDNINIACEYIEKNDFTKYFATQVDLQSQILITDEGISSKVSKAELISEINQSAEEIILKSNRLVVESDGFNLDGEGNMIATSGKIGGFELQENSLKVTHLPEESDFTQDDLVIVRDHVQNGTSLSEEQIIKYDFNGDGKVTAVDLIKLQNIVLVKNQNVNIEINSDDFENFINVESDNFGTSFKVSLTGTTVNSLTANDITIKDNNGNTTLNIFENGTILADMTNSEGGVWSIQNFGSQVFTVNKDGNVECVSLTQTSQEKNKKNFEKLNNALDIINRTEIYKYHLKSQNDDEKKHIGFVIGDKYNYSKEVTSINNDGVDLYSMVSVCFKAIQEQQKIIEGLKEMIK